VPCRTVGAPDLESGLPGRPGGPSDDARTMDRRTV
jgi:hypothetical protein